MCTCLKICNKLTPSLQLVLSEPGALSLWRCFRSCPAAAWLLVPSAAALPLPVAVTRNIPGLLFEHVPRVLHSWHIHPERRIQQKITCSGSLSPQTEALKCVAQASKNRSLADFEKVSQGHRGWAWLGKNQSEMPGLECWGSCYIPQQETMETLMEGNSASRNTPQQITGCVFSAWGVNLLEPIFFFLFTILFSFSFWRAKSEAVFH